MLYLAIQNSLILAAYDTLEAAEARCKEEIKKDALELFLKKKLIKKILKGQIPINGNRYLVAQIRREVTIDEGNFKVQNTDNPFNV